MADNANKNNRPNKAPPAKAAKAPQKNQKPQTKLTPEEEVKHIPKRVIEEHFLKGRYQQPHRTSGQRAADVTTRWVGSWTFILLLFVLMAIWMSLNIYLVVGQRWDPYPFILLNFVLSCLAAIQAPIILMSQNRQAEMDRMKAERDFSVNRKAEKEIEDMQHDLEIIKGMIRKIKPSQFKAKEKAVQNK